MEQHDDGSGEEGVGCEASILSQDLDGAKLGLTGSVRKQVPFGELAKAPIVEYAAEAPHTPASFSPGPQVSRSADWDRMKLTRC